MALHGKWSGCRSCYAALLLGGNCGLLSHSGCTQKTQQNEQCLTPQCCTRREEIHPKKALRQEKGQGLSGLPEENVVQRESAVSRRHLQNKKALCSAKQLDEAAASSSPFQVSICWDKYPRKVSSSSVPLQDSFLG